jgi:hypothetical protein
MNRKIVLFILLLSFLSPLGLFAFEMKSSTSNIEVELLVENENSEQEKDKEEYFFETTFILSEYLFVSILPSLCLLDEFTLEETLFRPPIV